MRQYVLYAMAVIFPVSLAGWFLWLLGKSLLQMYRDWQLETELVELQAQSAQHHEDRRQLNAARLDNGCEHDFESASHGLPPHTCSKCGIEREKPKGGCDHIWKSIPGSVPRSVCDKCGKPHSPLAE